LISRSNIFSFSANVYYDISISSANSLFSVFGQIAWTNENPMCAETEPSKFHKTKSNCLNQIFLKKLNNEAFKRYSLKLQKTLYSFSRAPFEKFHICFPIR
jgi:hypothetical protein